MTGPGHSRAISLEPLQPCAGQPSEGRGLHVIWIHAMLLARFQLRFRQKCLKTRNEMAVVRAATAENDPGHRADLPDGIGDRATASTPSTLVPEINPM